MPNNRKSVEFWVEKAELLRQNFTRPTIRIRDAMVVLNYNSTSAVEYALTEMEKLGLVEREVRDGHTYGDWYLT